MLTLSDEELLRALRMALRHLYETPALQANPLVAYLGLEGSPTAASDLRRILIEAIHSLQPEASVPADAEIWRVYEILQYRYVQQCTQAEVARQLGLSIRHLRREEMRAAEVLALALRTRLEKGETRGTLGEVTEDSFARELAWLEQSSAEEQIDLGALLETLYYLVRPMAEAHRTRVRLELPSEPIQVLSQPVGLRQIILSLLTMAIDRAVGGVVSVNVQRSEGGASIAFAAYGSANGQPEDPEAAQEHIAIVQRLARPCGARVKVQRDEEMWQASVCLTVPYQVPVLVIDDNQDTLRLLERYVSDTPFRLMGVHNIDEALDVVANAVPSIIVLDVMMPRVDGWEALGRLRQHPLTSRVPIIVCTILAQEELARSLGASDYLRKPVARSEFLQALERQCALAGRGWPSRPPYNVETPAG